jgi:SAM-dependent methyltransferase
MGEAGDVRAYYDEFADYQLRYLVTRNPRFAEIRKRVAPILAQRHVRSALDIGCGIGVQTDWLAGRVQRVVGVDISPRNIQIASAVFPRARFVVCDLPGEPLPEGQFDLVTAFDVLEHFSPADRPAVFGRIDSALAPHGVFAVNVPSRRFALRNPAETRQIIDEALGVDVLVAAAADIGLEPLTVDRFGCEFANQYVFLVFARDYDVESPVPSSGIVGRVRVEVESRVQRRRGEQLLANVPAADSNRPRKG